MTRPVPSPDDAVLAAAELAPRLAERATSLEQDGVIRSDVALLAEAGLLAVTGPPELGGVPRPAQREVAELLSGASPDLWFVWFQHGPVVKMLSGSQNTALQERYLARLCRGELQGGVAWSNLRTARPSVEAVRVEDGWLLTGPQPWCTGWPMVDVILVGGLARESGQVVFGIVERGTPGLTSTGELGLASMAGTSTHAVRFDELHLPDAAVVLVAPYDTWALSDTAANRNVQPSTFGIALAALDLLQERAPETADAMRRRVLDLRERAYRLLDEADPAEHGDERLELRAAALLLGIECCTALLASRGGRGMGLDDPAQRLLRAAAFQLVHSQAEHVRQATLVALAD